MTQNLDTRERLSAEYDDQRRRWYRTPEGDLLPSVTTFLDVLAKPKLENWKREQVAVWAIENLADWATLDDNYDPPTIVTRFDQETTMRLVAGGGEGGGKKKSGYGTSIHNLIERRLLGQEIQVPDQFAPAMRWLDEFLDMYMPSVLNVEPELVNRTLGYAGSPDLIARLDGPGFEDNPITVVDHKTGSGIFWETALQVCAYAKGEEILNVGPMPPVQATAGLWIRPEGWALYRFEYSERVWRAVVGARYLFAIQEEGMKIRGRAMNPGALKYKGSDW